MQKLLPCGVFIVAGMLSMQSFAVGTSAGKTIQNTASVTYRVSGATADSTATASYSFDVDELIDFTVTSQDAGPVTSSAPDNQVLSFRITNTGNGSEDFTVNAGNITGDAFDVTVGNIYIDVDGDGVINTAIDTLVTGPISLAADANATLLVEVTVPSGLSDGDNGQVNISVTSKAITDNALSNPPAGTVIAGAGGTGQSGNPIAAVIGSTQGNEIATGTLVITAVAVNITKSIASITDKFGGTKPLPGSIVRYQLDVAVTGSGSATNVVISDTLPGDLRFADTPGITLNGAAKTENTADSDGVGISGTTLTVNLGTVIAPNTYSVQFNAQIK